FFENQMQLGPDLKGAPFTAWADSGGLTMGYYDGSSMALYAIAQQNVLADNFFQAAFGGSFLNHQYLICACAPEYPNADTDPAAPTIWVNDRVGGKPWTTARVDTPKHMPMATGGPPQFVTPFATVAPKNYFGDNPFRAVNTMQPPYQPSNIEPAASD